MICMSDVSKTSNGLRPSEISHDKQERAARLDLLASCTAAGARAADEQPLKRLNLKHQMLKKIDAWAMDHKMPRLDAIHELLARGLKMKPKANGRINSAARVKEQRSEWIM